MTTPIDLSRLPDYLRNQRWFAGKAWPIKSVSVVDHAIVPTLRNRGLGTAIMRALMDEAAAAGIPVRLKVADANDPSLKLYLRLGFTPIEEAPFYIELEWTAPANSGAV